MTENNTFFCSALQQVPRHVQAGLQAPLGSLQPQEEEAGGQEVQGRHAVLHVAAADDAARRKSGAQEANIEG